MTESTKPKRSEIGTLLAAQAEQMCQECGPKEMADLILESGETAVLSYTSDRFKSTYRQIKPKSIDEVRQWMGVSPEVAAKTGRVKACGCGKSSRLVGEEDLESEDPTTRGQALNATRAAARSYVMGATVPASTKPVLDRYVLVTGALINVAFVQDIVVNNGATLTIASNTHSVLARNIRIYGTGKIVCYGPTTINCTNLEGDYKRRKVLDKISATDLTVAVRPRPL